MIIQQGSEKEGLNGEVSSLQAEIACLQQLVAELLLKNQQLREASADTED